MTMKTECREDDELVALLAKGQMQEKVYVKDTNGRYYLEVARVDEGYDYFPAEEGLEFIPLESDNTKWRVLRNEDVYLQQRSAYSHRAFMDQKVKKLESAESACRRMNWIDGMGKTLEELVLKRVAPTPIPCMRYVTDEEFIDLINDYKKHCASGGIPKDYPFQPLSSYASKLVTSSGKIIRPVYSGEVGMEGPTILVLKQGYGTGNLISVPDKVGT